MGKIIKEAASRESIDRLTEAAKLIHSAHDIIVSECEKNVNNDDLVKAFIGADRNFSLAIFKIGKAIGALIAHDIAKKL